MIYLPDGGVLGLAAHDDREALSNLIDHFKGAESCVGQLAYYQERPGWPVFRLQVENMRDFAIAYYNAGRAQRQLIGLGRR